MTRSRIQALARSPLAWILGVLTVVRVAGIGWGLPASDGWDNDGVAPRDFLAGILQTLAPGEYYTYPPVHLVLLAVLTAPVTIVALVRAPSLGAHDVVGTMLAVPYMTADALVARAVSVAMSIGIVWAIAKMTEEATGRQRAGWCAAAVVGTNVPLTYYAHTSNLDVPYLFWGCLALLAVTRAIARREPKRLRRAAVLAALAVATKDQAYALFLLGVPCAIAIAAWLDDGTRRIGRAFVRESAVALGIGAAVVAVGDAALFNPRGFAARVHFLLGPASQPYAQYSNDWYGRWSVVRDMGVQTFGVHPRANDFGAHYPLAFAALFALGLVLFVRDARGEDRARLAAGLVPAAAALSFTVVFNCVARRTDQRFVMPQSVLLAAYGGVAVEALVFGVRSALGRAAARAGIAAAFAVALYGALDVDAALLFDPRYDAEAWLRAHVRADDRVETYGLNVYLPRFPAGTNVTRVGPDPVDRRSPLPGVVEEQASFDGARDRGARYIVVSSAWAWRYLVRPVELEATAGRVLARTDRIATEDERGAQFFHALTTDAYEPYRLVHVSGWDSRVWPALDMHASTTREVWVYERGR